MRDGDVTGEFAMRSLCDAAEVADYRDEPQQLPAGAPGKNGFLRLGFEHRGSRSVLSELSHRAPLLAQQALYYDDGMPDLPCVMMICTAGGVLQGDRHAIEIALAENAEAHVTTQSATKIQEMDANFAAQTLDIALGENAYLEYLPDPTIPYRNARFVARTRIRLPQSATLLYSEMLLPGRTYHRSGERFEFALFSSATRAERPGGERLCSEKYVIEPRRREVRARGVMGSFDVFANVLLFTPPVHAERLFAETVAELNAERRYAAGATRMPNGAGIAYKIVGMEREAVQEKVREFCARVRRCVKNAETAPQFSWR
ncbi:MAG TPA: urease accessory protein UreD [Casimicrobiaceae bacterium]|nr:urease accessory protein UreD [Casimicrobiaceae bacterium]